jgi:hypothetical protein
MVTGEGPFKRRTAAATRSGKYEIWLVRPDGSGMRQLTFTGGGASVYYPFWSPDGKRLLYGTRGEPSTIIQVDVPWSEQSPQRLPFLSSKTRFGAWSWSPYGKRLAGRQSLLPGDEHQGLLIYSLESGEFKSLADFGIRPVWLRYNRRLMFMHEQKLFLVDENSLLTTELLSVAPYPDLPEHRRCRIGCVGADGCLSPKGRLTAFKPPKMASGTGARLIIPESRRSPSRYSSGGFLCLDRLSDRR